MSDRTRAASLRAAPVAPPIQTVVTVAPPIQAGYLGGSNSPELLFWQTVRFRAFWQTARSKGETLLRLWRTSLYLPLAGIGLVIVLVVAAASFALTGPIEPEVVASGGEHVLTKVQTTLFDAPTSPSECQSASIVVSEILPVSPARSVGIWSELAVALSAESAPAHAASEQSVRALSLRRSSDLSAAPVVAPELMEPVVVTFDTISGEEAVCNLDSCDGDLLETSIVWRRLAEQTFKDAIEQDKLVFMMHVSGNFALPEFT